MSVTFHTTRDPGSPPVAMLDVDAVYRINDALRARGVGFEIDPYGDTKLTDHHIALLLSLPPEAHDRDTDEALAALKPLDVVYAVGE